MPTITPVIAPSAGPRVKMKNITLLKFIPHQGGCVTIKSCCPDSAAEEGFLDYIVQYAHEEKGKDQDYYLKQCYMQITKLYVDIRYH